MRASIFLTLATSALAIAVPVYAGPGTSTLISPPSSAKAMVPDYQAAVSDAGRDEADVALD